MRCPHCTNDNARLLEQIADVSAPSETKGTAVQILCHVCAKSFLLLGQHP